MNDFEIFKNIILFKGLKEEDISRLFILCQRRYYDKGQVVTEEGEHTYSMFFFIDGEAVISSTMTMKATGHSGGFSEVEKSLVKLSAGQVSIIGEMSVLEDLPRSATVKAYTACTFYEISKEDFQEFVVKYPEAGAKILLNISRILCNRVRRGNKDIIKLSTALSIALSKVS
jgi:CRP/FNR family transcriptional regulator, cyclic AMP receptor protein